MADERLMACGKSRAWGRLFLIPETVVTAFRFSYPSEVRDAANHFDREASHKFRE